MKPPIDSCARLLIAALIGLFGAALFAADQVGKEIIRGSDRFEFVYRVKLPELSNRGRLWLPLAKSDSYQTVEAEDISAAEKWLEVRDRDHGNRVLFLAPTPADSGTVVEIRYRVARKEKSAYTSAEGDPARFLKTERLVPTNHLFASIAEEVTRGKTGALRRGRALYDHVLRRMKYDKSGTGWGRGDALWACEAGRGNCSDFHAYFIALARSVGIPARFAIGLIIPADQEEGQVPGYHCWAEFFAEGKWVPVDISEAWKTPALADYYFGHHPANRFELSAGRDLFIEPAPASSPVNFLVYPLLEVDGRTMATENQFRFRRLRQK